MAHKILLSGKNQLVINEFYSRDDSRFDLLTSSTIFRDMVKNLELFKPDLFLYCVSNETSDDYSRFKEFYRFIEKAGCGFAIMGSHEECESFKRAVAFPIDLVLEKPLTSEVIFGNIYAWVLDRDKKLAAEQAPAPAAAPTATPVQTANNTMAMQQPQAQPAPAEVRRKHVLVIDDDPLMLKLIKEYLHDRYDVATAVSGKIAYKFLESKTTDMILLDYEMPGESGPEVFLNLRTRHNLDGIPIVFLTGVSDSERVKEVLNLGPQGYLLKPIDKEKLMKIVDSKLSK